MCRTALTVAAVIVLVGGSGPKVPHPLTDAPVNLKVNITPRTHIFQRQIDDVPPYNVGDSYDSVRKKLFYALTNGESTEEQQSYTYNNYFAPSTVNFHDIYSNSLALLAEEPITTMKDDPAFHLNNIPTKYVEFHPHTQTVPPVTSPPPMYLLNASFVKNESLEISSTTTTSTSTTTEEPEEVNVRVIPIKQDYQRGVLDLLFPAARVRTFKSVFDTFRRIMSHTFR